MNDSSRTSRLRPTTTYAEFTAGRSWRTPVRAALRDAALRLLVMGRDIDGTTNWIRFPYYHHVFSDERTAFAHQLDYLKRFGEFVSLDDAVSLVAGGDAIDGRYFALSFDDGLKSCRDGAVPILAERGIPAAFYVVTDMIGRRLDPGEGPARAVFGFKGRDTFLEFLGWDDCRAMAAGGMTIASHGRRHARLSTLDAEAALAEMTQSKQAIEAEIGAECRHFCPPYGIPERDLDLERDGELARRAGYRSMAIGWRGATRRGADPFSLRRDHLIAGWGLHQVRYFLSLP